VYDRRVRRGCFVCLVLAGCRGLLGIEDPTVAPPDAAVPSGAHSGYVIDSLQLPRTNGEAKAFALDLDGDGIADNGLGEVFASLDGQGLSFQAATDEAIAKGALLMLVDLQTSSFTSAPAAGLAVRFGSNPMPPACASPMDATCRRHLTGTAVFQLAGGSPKQLPLVGPVAAGNFVGGPGELSLLISLSTRSEPIRFDLVGARVNSRVFPTELVTTIIGGAVTMTDLDGKVLPAVHAQIAPIVTADCTDPTMPPNCGCMAGSTGKTILGLFDTTMPRDCMVSLDEVRNNSLIKSLLSPDVTIDGVPALSLGVQVTAVGASFPLGS
jgi:hypothetical protein